MDSIEMQRIIRNYYEKLLASKLENLKGIDKFLDSHDIPKLNQENTYCLNNTLNKQWDWRIIEGTPSRGCAGPDDFTTEYYKTLKDEVTISKYWIWQNSTKFSIRSALLWYRN